MSLSSAAYKMDTFFLPFSLWESRKWEYMQGTLLGFWVKIVLAKYLTLLKQKTVLESESIIFCLGDNTWCCVYELTDSP